MATKEKKQEGTFDNILTAEDLFREAGPESYCRVEFPELPKNGKPGVVYLRPLQAKDVLRFMDVPEGERNYAILDLIAVAAVTNEGIPIFSPEQAEKLRSISITAFNRLATAVTQMATVGEAGETEENP